MGSDLSPFTENHESSEECDLIDFYRQEKLAYNFFHFFQEGLRRRYMINALWEFPMDVFPS